MWIEERKHDKRNVNAEYYDEQVETFKKILDYFDPELTKCFDFAFYECCGLKETNTKKSISNFELMNTNEKSSSILDSSDLQGINCAVRNTDFEVEKYRRLSYKHIVYRVGETILRVIKAKDYESQHFYLSFKDRTFIVFIVANRIELAQYLNTETENRYLWNCFLPETIAQLFGHKEHNKYSYPSAKRYFDSINYQAMETYLFIYGIPNQDFLNQVSSLKYEGSSNLSKVACTAGLNSCYETILTLKEPISLDMQNARTVRKLMEVATGDKLLNCDSDKAYSIIKKVNTSKFEGDIFTVEIVGNMSWKVCYGNICTVEMKDGQVRIPNYKSDLKFVKNRLYNHYKNLDMHKKERLLQIIEAAAEQKHGTSIIISDDAAKESARLCGADRGLLIEKISLIENIDFIKNITSIDGAIIIDHDCLCYSIGVILDGVAIVKGNKARGARYNSIYNYIAMKHFESLDYLAVIISEDGMVDLVSSKINAFQKISEMEI